MMISQTFKGEKPESYSSFKNKTFNKYESKIKTICTNIRTNSLHKNDKHKLLMKLEQIINDEAFIIN